MRKLLTLQLVRLYNQILFVVKKRWNLDKLGLDGLHFEEFLFIPGVQNSPRNRNAQGVIRET